MQRDKGANFEREIANLLKAEGFNARRGGLMQSQNASSEPDVIVDDLPGLWIECKRGARTYPLAALKQAREASGGAGMPVAVCKDDREKITATIDFDFFMMLLSSFVGIETKPAPVQEPRQIDLEELVCKCERKFYVQGPNGTMPITTHEANCHFKVKNES